MRNVSDVKANEIIQAVFRLRVQLCTLIPFVQSAPFDKHFANQTDMAEIAAKAFLEHIRNRGLRERDLTIAGELLGSFGLKFGRSKGVQFNNTKPYRT